MTGELYQKVTSEGGVAQLSDRAKWSLSGADRVRYLNGQITNDARRAKPDAAIYACVTNIKGKIEGDLFLHSAPGEGSALLLDAEGDLREPLGIRLERYIISDDAVLEDVTENWKLWHFFGPASLSVASLSLPEGAHTVQSNRFGGEGIDLWWPAQVETPAFAASAPLLSAEELECWRILAGIARWPYELNHEAFPPEAGIQKKAMDYTKGCYIGQEILSRIKTSGKMPKVLVRVQSASSELRLERGGRLFTLSEEGKEVEAGQITSMTRHPALDLDTGLAYVRHIFSASHSLLPACEDMPRMGAEVAISPL